MPDLIYHHSFFTANSLGHQPTTSQYFQPLTLQPLALAAAAIHCMLSQYDSGIKATVMFSQDVYRGTFYPSPVVNCTPEATVLKNPTFVGRLIPPLKCKSVRIGAPQFLSLLLGQDWHSYSSLGTKFPPVPLGLDSCFFIQFHLLYPSPPSSFGTRLLVWMLLNPHRHSSA